nr:hypothetical protein [Tanacetum cinerariifolium]
MVHYQEDTPADQPQDQEDLYVQERPNAGRFTKKSRSADLEGAGFEKLKQQYKNDVELKYHIDQLKAAVSTEAQWNTGEGDVSKPRSFESHMSKSTKPHLSFYNKHFYYLVSLSTGEKYATSPTKHFIARYYIKGIKDMVSERWSKEVHRYQIEALNGIHHWKDRRQDFFKAEINNKTPRKVYSDKRIISVVSVVVKRKWGYRFVSSIVVRRSDKQEYTFNYADLPILNLNDIEDMHLLKVQDKLHYLELEFEKDFNNTLLLFIRRIVIKNKVKDLITYTMSGAEKRIQENLIEMVTKNKLGRGNERLKGRDWNEKDIKRSKEMLNKIDQVMKRRE